MTSMPSAATVAAVVDTHRRFDGRVVYRQVPTGLAGQPRTGLVATHEAPLAVERRVSHALHGAIT